MPTKNQPPGSLSVSPLLSVTMLLIGALLQADRLLLNDNLAAFFQSAPAATVTLESSLGWCGKAECPVVPNNNNQATPEYREDSICRLRECFLFFFQSRTTPVSITSFAFAFAVAATTPHSRCRRCSSSPHALLCDALSALGTQHKPSSRSFHYY
jgi:hypothetical protein